MKRSILTAGLAAALLTSACNAVQSEPHYGVCRAEIDDYVRTRLQLTPTRIEVQSYSERTPPLTQFDAGNALVYVKECSGFHSFEIRGTQDLCEYIPHYGTRSASYVRYEGAFEGCKKV